MEFTMDQVLNLQENKQTSRLMAEPFLEKMCGNDLGMTTCSHF